MYRVSEAKADAKALQIASAGMISPSADVSRRCQLASMVTKVAERMSSGYYWTDGLQTPAELLRCALHGAGYHVELSDQEAAQVLCGVIEVLREPYVRPAEPTRVVEADLPATSASVQHVPEAPTRGFALFLVGVTCGAAFVAAMLLAGVWS